jgi:hypothetical protein
MTLASRVGKTKCAHRGIRVGTLSLWPPYTCCPVRCKLGLGHMDTATQPAKNQGMISQGSINAVVRKMLPSTEELWKKNTPLIPKKLADKNAATTLCKRFASHSVTGNTSVQDSRM